MAADVTAALTGLIVSYLSGRSLLHDDSAQHRAHLGEHSLPARYGYIYQSTSIRREFDFLSKVIKFTVTTWTANPLAETWATVRQFTR